MVKDSTYITVWLGLLVLTCLTVAVSGLNLGVVSILLTLFIASVKVLLVVLFFMHLRYEKPIFRIMFLFAAMTVVIILGVTFFDYTYR